MVGFSDPWRFLNPRVELHTRCIQYALLGLVAHEQLLKCRLAPYRVDERKLNGDGSAEGKIRKYTQHQYGLGVQKKKSNKAPQVLPSQLKVL